MHTVKSFYCKCQLSVLKRQFRRLQFKATIFSDSTFKKFFTVGFKYNNKRSDSPRVPLSPVSLCNFGSGPRFLHETCVLLYSTRVSSQFVLIETR